MPPVAVFRHEKNWHIGEHCQQPAGSRLLIAGIVGAGAGAGAFAWFLPPIVFGDESAKDEDRERLSV
jgi:hypothetical protein